MSLKVVRDRPSVRRAYGINAPMFVSLAGGERTRAREWSRLGMVVERQCVPPAMGDGGTVHAALHLNFQGYDIQVPARARMDRTGEADPGPDLVRLEFVDLSPRSAELIEHFVDDYVRGRLVPAQDTLVRIDAPPEPISTKPDKPPDEATRRSVKPFVMSAIYLALGIAVMGYLGVLFYANAVRLEVTSAVLTRPMHAVLAVDGGVVSAVPVRLGDRVAGGQLLAQMENPELEERIERARAVVQTAAQATTRARRRLRIDEERIRDYARLGNATKRLAERELRRARRDWFRSVDKLREVVSLRDERPLKGARDESCEARLKPRERADLVLLRTMVPSAETIKSFLRRREVPCFVLTDLYRDQVRLRRAYDDALKALDERLSLSAVGERRLFNGREFIVDLDVATLARDKAKANEGEARAMLAALERSRDRASVRAPLDGRIANLRAAPAQSLARGETIAVIEAEVPPVIQAYLDQDEVALVRLGDRADAYLPALDRTIAATISEIDRTAGFLDEQNAIHRWRGPKDRSALVTLRLDGNDGEGVASGQPVTVLFHRRRPSFVARQALRDLTGSAAAPPVAAIDAARHPDGIGP